MMELCYRWSAKQTHHFDHQQCNSKTFSYACRRQDTPKLTLRLTVNEVQRGETSIVVVIGQSDFTIN